MSIHLMRSGIGKANGVGGGGGWGSDQYLVNTTPASSDSGDNTALTFGTYLRVDVNGRITGARVYRGAANTQTGITIGLFKMTDYETYTEVATKTGLTIAASGWSNLLFDTPVTVSAGEFYVVTYTKPSGGNTPYYYYTANAFASGVDNTSGDLYGPADQEQPVGFTNPLWNGRYGVGAYAFPTNGGSKTWYGVDPIFQKAL